VRRALGELARGSAAARQVQRGTAHLERALHGCGCESVRKRRRLAGGWRRRRRAARTAPDAAPAPRTSARRGGAWRAHVAARCERPPATRPARERANAPVARARAVAAQRARCRDLSLDTASHLPSAPHHSRSEPPTMRACCRAAPVSPLC
jgi:hypothetical protein